MNLSPDLWKLYKFYKHIILLKYSLKYLDQCGSTHYLVAFYEIFSNLISSWNQLRISKLWNHKGTPTQKGLWPYCGTFRIYDAWRTSSVASEPPRKWKLIFVQKFYLVCMYLKIDEKNNISMNLLQKCKMRNRMNFRLLKILQLC